LTEAPSPAFGGRGWGPRKAGILALAWGLLCWSSLLAVDCNHNDVDDLEDVASGRSFDCDADGTPDECEFTPFQLGQRDQSIEVGVNPRAAIVVDLNGDGRDDIAVSDQSSATGSNLVVVLALPDGTLAPPTVRPGLPVPSAITAGDFDGDDDTDLVTANFTSAEIFFNDGDGTFSESTGFEVPRSTRVLVAADLTGDGLDDLATLSSDDSSISVFASTGGGTFALPTAFPTGGNPKDIVATDLDSDVAIDLVTANRDNDDVSVLINTGAGTFAAAVHLDAAARRPVSLATGDLNRDGSVDLVVEVRDGVSIFLGEGFLGEGDASFSAPVFHEVADGSPTVGDFNGDDNLDVVLGHPSGNLTIFPGTEAGEFRTRVQRASEFIPQVSAGGDLDADGDLDLVIVSREPARLNVLWNRIRGPREGSLTLEASRYIVGSEPHSATLADVNGDGALDFVTANGACRSATVFQGIGNGTFERQVTYPMANSGHLNSVTAIDLDGDADVDLALVDNQGGRVHVLLGEAGTFGPFQSYAAGEGAFMITDGDIDGDGAQDLITADSGASCVSILFNSGSGSFEEIETVETGSSPFAVAAVDLDLDGDIDLAVPSASAASLRVLENDGSGKFPSFATYPTPRRPVYVHGGDFNGDGQVDLVTVQQASREAVALFLNGGDGSFLPTPPLEVPEVPYSVVVTDLHDDTHDDLVITSELGGALVVVPGNGDGSFGASFRFQVGTGPRFSDAGDLDGDGDIDLVAANRMSTNITALINQSGSVAAAEDYLERICTGFDFDRLTVAISAPPGGMQGAIERSGKYVLPARDPASDPSLLPTVYQNARRFALHQEFLAAAFPDRFSGLSAREYNDLVGRRASRDYFVGVIHRLRTDEGVVYGASILTDTSDPAELLGADEVREVIQGLEDTFTLRPLGYFPEGTLSREVAASWPNPGFPIYVDSGPQVSYVPYTRAVGFGRVRLLDAEAFATANDEGQISFQSILVLAQAPRDIEGVVGGVITAEPQGELSHVSVRTARRNTPNAFVEDALDVLAPYDGKLVRLEVRDTDFDVREASLDEAQEFWQANRPQLGVTPEVDETFGELSSLAEIAVLDGAGEDVVSRFGGKASNLARLQTILTRPWSRYQERGFAIPARYYLEFVRSNRLPSALDAAREVTYEEYVGELLLDGDFQSDSEFRFAALDNLRDHMRDEGVVDTDLVARIATRVSEVLNSPSTVRVRFRSSSNVEDGLEFNGAGLYDSTSGCAEDDLDGDPNGPSHCDPTRENERGVTRALKKVWASLWNFRAFEERAFFGIPQDRAAMAVLVNRAFIDEAAQGVAFTGNPLQPLDRRYVVTVQQGEESVVSPAPGVRAEKDLLEVTDGVVQRITRAATSSLVAPGSVVLTDAQLLELGALMAHMDDTFPLELGGFERSQVLLDLEFKFLQDGSLAVKQVRPFLLNVPVPPAPTFELEILPGQRVCGTFGVSGANRGVREEYEIKSQLRFRSGKIELPTTADSFSAELVEELRMGPEQEVAVAVTEGLVRFLRVAGGDGVVRYRFTFEQEFTLADGRSLELALVTPLEFEARGEDPVARRLVLDKATLAEMFTVNAGFEPLLAMLDGAPLIRYGSCGYETLPPWEIRLELEGGVRLRLEEHFLEAESLFATAPAALVRADVSFDGDVRSVTDYWSLVYSAFRHNTSVTYWVLLEPPFTLPAMDLPGLTASVHGLEIRGPDLAHGAVAEVLYLDADLEVLTSVAVQTFERAEFTPPAALPFRRGDVQGEGGVDLSDAVMLLDFIFQRGLAPSCRDAADANDDGRVNLLDAVGILAHLFRNAGALPAPFETCGEDATADALGCRTHDGC